jgi:hypothetical protein
MEFSSFFFTNACLREHIEQEDENIQLEICEQLIQDYCDENKFLFK